MFVYKNTLLTMSSPSEWTHRNQLFINQKHQKTLFHIERNETKLVDESVLDSLIIEVLEKTIKNVPLVASQCKKIMGAIDEFNKQTKEEKIKITSAIISGCNSSKSTPDIKIGETLSISRLGRLGGKKLNDLDNTLFIEQSITGIYKRVYKL